MSPVSRSFSRGFTLVEMLISMIVLAIVGAGLVQMVMSQGRFMDHQEAWRSSRAVARSSLNRLFAEVRNVEGVGGVEAAAAGGTDFTLRVPYAYGIMCATNGTTTTLSLLPVDSAMYGAPGFSGFAWRDATGVYTLCDGRRESSALRRPAHAPRPTSRRYRPSTARRRGGP